jgi:hypothetical protein
MPDSTDSGLPAADTSDDFRAAAKINDASLVPNLLFAFFGHLPGYGALRDPLVGRDDGLSQLNKLLTLLFEAIKAADFDRERFHWITDEVIETNFRNREFNQYYEKVKQAKLAFRRTKAAKLRTNVAGIAALARVAFLPGQSEHKYVDELRSILKLVPVTQRTYGEQTYVFDLIEEAMRSIDTRPDWAISFDDENRPVLKTNKAEFFPPRGEIVRDQIAAEGSFVVFRRVLQVTQPRKTYLREYLKIELRSFGLTFRWLSRGGVRDDILVLTGVGLFTKGGLWLMGHTSKHLQRIRVLAADIVDWEEHKDHRRDYCTARLLTHRHEARRSSPVTRPVLLKRDREAFWRNESFDERCRFLTKVEIKKLLTPEELRIIDAKE